MRVDEEVLECVCFLGTEIERYGNTTLQYGGTAFFVSVPSEQFPNTKYIYLVTARHCIEKAKEEGALQVRLNTSDGGSKMIRLDSEWYMPDDESQDVAILPIPFSLHGCQHKPIPRKAFVTDELIQSAGIGIGDTLLTVGMFISRQGKHRNLPIVRSGIIASMHDEPITDRNTALDYNAYLAEMRSIGGLSGSPVNVVIETYRVDDKTPVSQPRCYLLGLIRSHWKHDKPDDERDSAMDYSDSEREALNMGIASVTPISYISSLLDRDDLKKLRRAKDKQLAMEATESQVLDSGFGTDSSHSDRFLDTVKRLATTPKTEFDKAEEARKAKKSDGNQ